MNMARLAKNAVFWPKIAILALNGYHNQGCYGLVSVLKNKIDPPPSWGQNNKIDSPHLGPKNVLKKRGVSKKIAVFSRFTRPIFEEKI